MVRPVSLRKFKDITVCVYDMYVGTPLGSNPEMP